MCFPLEPFLLPTQVLERTPPHNGPRYSNEHVFDLCYLHKIQGKEKRAIPRDFKFTCDPSTIERLKLPQKIQGLCAVHVRVSPYSFFSHMYPFWVYVVSVFAEEYFPTEGAKGAPHLCTTSPRYWAASCTPGIGRTEHWLLPG
eukprot:gb/GECG01008999.1/.p1 GENE.gb/GECG01008999.1/~~gb/GECG01008999.1/.p1  ORF type:complete len:143 (+),score=3.37 gb/GECG01008999.1/:1-429(+)